MSDYTAKSSLLSPGRCGQARWSDRLEERAKTLAQANNASWIVATYHRLALPMGINPDLALAQACEEAAWFTSDRWVRQHNPCGLGITSDDVPGHVFASPGQGIIAHLCHLCCYAYTAEDCPVWHPDNPDFRHLFHDGKPALSHLQEPKPGRRWAEKDGYVSRILAISNAVLRASQPPSATTGGTMPPKPQVTSSPSPNRGYNNGHTHRVEAIVNHITDGTNSLGWLTNPASNASSNYLIARNGTIYELVPPTESAWANGAVRNPDTGHPLIAKWLREGCNFNQRCVSIEHENKSSQRITPQQVAASVRLQAWLCGEFGLSPLTALIGHNQIDSRDRAHCPGWTAADWAAIRKGIQAALGGGTPAPASGMLSPIVTPALDWGAGSKGRIIAVELTSVNDTDPANPVYHSAKKEWRADGTIVQGPWKEV